jgi:hypothetical protein
MYCTRCRTGNAYRVARTSLIDIVSGWLGYFPYACRSCCRKFRSRVRRPPAPAEPSGPTAEYRCDSGRHTAAIVVRAETGEQLTHILLALSTAVEKEQNAAHAPEGEHRHM